MNKQKTSKALLIIAVVLLAVQVPWYFTVQVIVNKTLVKTTATVIQINSYDSNCTLTYRSTCDPSNILAPVFEYKDQAGKTYTQSDQYLDGYKQNNPLIKLFGKKVGDKVTAYYSKGNPKAIVFMDGLLAYTAWLIPLYLAIPISIIGGLLLLFNRRQLRGGIK